MGVVRIGPLLMSLFSFACNKLHFNFFFFTRFSSVSFLFFSFFFSLIFFSPIPVFPSFVLFSFPLLFLSLCPVDYSQCSLLKYKRRIRVGTCKMLASYLRESLSLKTTTRGCRRPSSLIKTRNENSKKKKRKQNPGQFLSHTQTVYIYLTRKPD